MENCYRLCVLKYNFVVTPSYKQAQFLERTILNVLNQKYPNLEFIINGGPTEGSAEITKKDVSKLAYCISELSALYENMHD